MDRFTGAFIVACWVGLFAYIYIAIAVFGAKRTVERNSQWWRIILLIIAGVAISFLPHLRAHTPDELVLPGSLPREIAADAVSFAGFVVGVWARTVLGGNWSSSAAFKQGQELIERGPYRYVRHPMYSGILLLVVGLAIWSGSIFGLALLLVCFGALWLRSRQEEALLTRHFPVAYPEYKRRTKAALIPFVA